MSARELADERALATPAATGTSGGGGGCCPVDIVCLWGNPDAELSATWERRSDCCVSRWAQRSCQLKPTLPPSPRFESSGAHMLSILVLFGKTE